MGKKNDKKYQVEIKQSRKGHYFLGSLKINADSITEMEELMDSALSSVMHKIALLNESIYKAKRPQTKKQITLTNSEDKELFEKLRKWRLELARTEKVRPFMIFHDSTLKEVALRKPQTSSELFRISGIGRKKYERYGEIILKMVHEFNNNKQRGEIRRNNTSSLEKSTKMLKMETESHKSKILLQGDKVKIQNKPEYSGEVGEIVGYDGFKYYEIELMGFKETICCLGTEIQRASEEEVNKYKVEICLNENNIFTLNVQNLKPSIEALKDNQIFKGLYSLGKYYPQQRYPEKHYNDYFSQKIIELKNLNTNAAKEISEIFKKFIKSSELLTKITDDLDYIVMMPTTKETNHVSLWGDQICEVFDKKNLTKYIYINPTKVEHFSSYVYKDPWARRLTTKGAYKFNKADSSFPLLSDKSCLILDDVCTTGNQINELTNLLASEGVREVFAFVIGKTKFS